MQSLHKKIICRFGKKKTPADRKIMDEDNLDLSDLQETLDSVDLYRQIKTRVMEVIRHDRERQLHNRGVWTQYHRDISDFHGTLHVKLRFPGSREEKRTHDRLVKHLENEHRCEAVILDCFENPKKSDESEGDLLADGKMPKGRKRYREMTVFF